MKKSTIICILALELYRGIVAGVFAASLMRCVQSRAFGLEQAKIPSSVPQDNTYINEVPKTFFHSF